MFLLPIAYSDLPPWDVVEWVGEAKKSQMCEIFTNLKGVALKNKSYCLSQRSV